MDVDPQTKAHPCGENNSVELTVTREENLQAQKLQQEFMNLKFILLHKDGIFQRLLALLYSQKLEKTPHVCKTVSQTVSQLLSKSFLFLIECLC